jgi:hypothetical protein
MSPWSYKYHHQLAVCLSTGPNHLPKRALHIAQSRASSCKWEYPLISLRSSSSFLRLLPRLPITYISPFIFPSITRCRRQFLRKMWPIQLAFSLHISCRIFLCSLTLSNTSSFLSNIYKEYKLINTKKRDLESLFTQKEKNHIPQLFDAEFRRVMVSNILCDTSVTFPFFSMFGWVEWNWVKKLTKL